MSHGPRMRQRLAAALSVLALNLASCGGGSDESARGPVSGRWTGTLAYQGSTATGNANCTSKDAKVVDWDVSTNGNDVVVLEHPLEWTWRGSMQGTDGFTVNFPMVSLFAGSVYSAVVSGAQAGQAAIDYQVENYNAEKQADGTFLYSSCVHKWSGSLTRLF